MDIAEFCEPSELPAPGKFNLFMRLQLCYTQSVPLTSAVQHLSISLHRSGGS